MITTRIIKSLAAATLLASSATIAHTADIVGTVIEPAPVVVAPAIDWTGFYAGVHAGYGWGDRDWDGKFYGKHVDDERFRYDLDGALAGGQVGFNWQVNSFLLGIEADAAWSDVKGSGLELFRGVGIDVDVEVDWLATLRGRAGFAWDRWLVYGTGGVAWAGVDTNVTRFGGGVRTDNASATHTGWVAGLGAEAMLTERWSLKLEYLHAEFDDEEFDYDLFGGSGQEIQGHANLDLDTVRFGVNFHF